MVTHGNVLDYARWGATYFELGRGDRVLSTAPFYFDMSVFDVYCSVKAGACLCLVAEHELMFPGKLVKVIEDHEATLWKGVSSLLSYLSRTAAIGASRLQSLRTIVFAGEPLPSKHLAHWMRTYPSVRFYNGYGPTECTGVSVCHSFEDPVAPDDRVPLGLPCANTEVFVLREDTLATCDVGEIGEICIRGAGVSAGYWNDSQRTASRFLESIGAGGERRRIYRTGDAGFIDANGVLWMTGRLDDQVKVQGYRIELGDVVSALGSLDEVDDAAALPLPDGAGNDALVAFFVAVQPDVSVATVWRALTERLPAYMMPKTLHRLDCLPRTERGKLDKTALRELHACGRIEECS
jgi:acyl-coenzyme A synthetase/AMP-(fatty) acid ligase